MNYFDLSREQVRDLDRRATEESGGPSIGCGNCFWHPGCAARPWATEWNPVGVPES